MSVDNKNLKLKNQYLRDDVIEIREYQVQIALNCVNKNSLVVIPTGLGKTIISVYVAAKTLELYPPDSKVILLAPTRPLISQHYNTFIKFLSIPPEKFCILTGKILPEKRAKLYHNSQFLFYTPQTLRNDLVKRKYSLEDTCLIVFDEAHHASGDYPYTMIVDEYLDQNPDGNILALTASPGASKERIKELCDSLHIPSENTHFRTRKDTDVSEYLKPLEVYKISANLTALMKDTYSVLKIVLEERLQYLSQLNFLETRSENLFKKIIRKDLLKLNSELVSMINDNGDKTGVYSALSITAQGLILFHMIELVEQQGLDNVLTYFEEKIYKEVLKQRCSKAVRILASDYRLRRVYLELKQNKEYTPENLVHPKYQILEKLLLNELNHNPDSRILVFVKLRVSVSNITNKLKTNEIIKAIKFVGQTTKSKEDKGLSQKKQIEILDKFREGEYNVLVSTNVGEEGLDIAECDMVVFYDVVASEIRFIQRRGRTARHREGKVVILYTKETNDDIYLKIALNKLKKMNINLNSKGDLNYRYNVNERISNYETKPFNDINSGITNNNINKNKNDHGYSKNKRKYQSSLKNFVNSEATKHSIKKIQIKFDIILSNVLPMKLGLRRKLSNENFSFQTIESEQDIIIFKKVVINIYDPKEFSKEFKNKLISINTQLKNTYQLVINIFNFIDFRENIEGEFRLLKRKLQEFGKINNLQIISIDNPEELIFIVKNIHEQNK